MKLYQKIVLICLVFISCKNNSKEKSIAFKTEKTVINITNYSSEVLKTLSNLKFLKIETKSEGLFSYPDKVIIKNNVIYIYQFLGGKSQRLLAFDERTGKFLHRIGGNGNSPEHYQFLKGFYVSTKYIFLLDINRLHLKKYTLNGEFIENIPVPFEYPDAFIKLKNGNFLFSLEKIDINKPKIVETDSLFNIVNQHFSYSDFDTDFVMNFNVFRESGNFISYNKAVNDTVYTFDHFGKPGKRIIVDFKNRKVPRKLLKDFSKLRRLNKQNKFDFFAETPLLIKDDFLISKMHFGNTKGLLVSSLKHKHNYQFLNAKSKKSFLYYLLQASFVNQEGFIVSFLDINSLETDNFNDFLNQEQIAHLKSEGILMAYYKLHKDE